MKSGTGDDPFADPFEETEEIEEPDETTAEETESEPATDTQTESEPRNEANPAVETGATADEQSNTGSESESHTETSSASNSSDTTEADDSGRPDNSHIPWVLRRSSVKDDRPNITQFFLRDETDRAERALRSDVEQILDKDVYTLDLREAAYLVAMEHPDEVAETLRDWGYDYLD